MQVVAAIVLAVISVLLLVTIHRLELPVAGIDLPIGLVMGAVFQLAALLFLVASTGRRLPLVVLTAAWGALVIPFSGNGAGGGVLMPGALGDQIQYQGWIVQLIGVGVPLLVLVVMWAVRMRTLLAARDR